MTLRRILLGVGIATIGIVLALLVGGATIPPCLGLTSTPVRCANGTGILPTVGALVPMLLLAIALGALVVVPPRRTRWHALLGGTGLVLGVAWYLVTRPTLLEGPDYDGTSLSLPMPIEIDALVAWALAGGLMGLVTASVWRRSRSGSAPGMRGLELIDPARRPSVAELLAGARERAIRTQSRLPADRILEHRNADRR